MAETFVHIQIAQCPRVAWFAIASICSRLIDTNAISTDALCAAFIDVRFAVGAVVAAGALAIVFVPSVVARGTIQAWAGRASPRAVDAIRANAFNAMADHWLLTIVGVADFQTFAPLAFEAGRTLAYCIRVIGNASAPIQADAWLIGRPR